MARNIFPDEPATIVGVLLDLYRHQNQPEFVRVLENSSASMDQTDYDNWNGGTYIYTLSIKIPMKLFATIESSIGKLEKGIKAKFDSVFRDNGNLHLGGVVIAPDTEAATGKPKPVAREEDIERIWGDRPFRLFLSHTSPHKGAVASLKDDLHMFGISAFVAHEDIEPLLEWQTEIQKALFSMHALAALLTPDLHKSNWTDQEVGVAIGRGILTIPVRLGLDPYGFLAKLQGMPGDLKDARGITNGLLDIILKQEHLKKEIQEALIFAFEKAPHFAESKAIVGRIETFEYLSERQLERLEVACRENDQVRKSFGVPGRVEALKRKFGVTVDEVPF